MASSEMSDIPDELKQCVTISGKERRWNGFIVAPHPTNLFAVCVMPDVDEEIDLNLELPPEKVRYYFDITGVKHEVATHCKYVIVCVRHQEVVMGIDSKVEAYEICSNEPDLTFYEVHED